MELMVAVTLLALFGAWWIVRSKTNRNSGQVARQRTTLERSLTPPTLLTNAQSERPAPQNTLAPAEPQPALAFAEIVDPRGGVREISAKEVSAYFLPVRTKLASLRQVAANSTRVAKAFEQSGGPTPHLELYRSAHTDAVALTAETAGLLDIMLFASQADSNSYDDLLEYVIDVEIELEDNIATIVHVESEIASGRFRPAIQVSVEAA